jgi:hypothetical protein
MISIIAFLKALPATIQLIGRLAELMNRLIDWSNKNNINQWINDLEANIDALEKAKTPAEKISAAKSLVSSILDI